MILRLFRKSPKIAMPSSFIVINIGDKVVVSFTGETAYQRRGIKTVLMNHVFITKKYTESNCDNLLKYIQR